MDINVTVDIPTKPDCWQQGGFSCCQKLSRSFREKTQSQYFECNLFQTFLAPITQEGNPIEPCNECMEARGVA